MKQIIEDLFPMNATLLGEGYDNRLKYLQHLIDLEVQEFPTGTQFGTWTVPEEWVVRDAWVKFNGKKIINFKKQPLSLVNYSLPFSGTVDKEELLKHMHFAEECEDDYSFEFKFYERDWGFTMPKTKIDNLKDGEYEVLIDTEFRPGVMKVATHTIKGKTDKEVLLFAHLDHPYQANDNLSAVACLVDMVKKVRPETYDHTIKLVFCPETIGSIAFASKLENVKNVDFVIALDIVGNTHEQGILLQKTMHKDTRLDDVANLALRGMGTGYRQAGFRNLIGSDEYVFNDPDIGIPAILFTTFPYPEYHTSADTPDKISIEQIEKVQYAVLKTIEYYEKDCLITKNFAGPLHRSKYGIQTKGKQLNLSWDYLVYSMNGEEPLSKLCIDYGLNFEHTYEFIERLAADGVIYRSPALG